MTHDYDNCEKSLEQCRWCKAKAEKTCVENGFDIQELDSTLLFREQAVMQIIQEAEDDGVHNEAARELLHLDKKKRSKKKGYPMDITRILEGLDYLGADGCERSE